MSEKEAYETKLQAQLDEWQADVDKLRARLKNAEADAKLEIKQQMNDLQAKQDKAKTETQ